MAERPKKITLQDTLASQSERKQPPRASKETSEEGLSAFFAWLARLSLLLVLCVSPWMIASVTPGAQLILAAVLLIGLASWWIESGLTAGRRQIVPYVVVFVLLGIAIGFLQTLELPESVSNIVAGRQVEINEKYGQSVAGSPVRLTLDIEGTWYQLRLLIIALTCLLLGSRYFRTSQHLATFLSVILINGVALTAFGLVQKFRFNGKLFWEIELTQGGSPFGPFVCRNNAAGYLVMCFSAGAGLLLLLMTKKHTSRPHQIVSDEIPVWRQAKTHLGIFVANLDAKRLAVLAASVFVSIGVVASLSRGGVIALLAAWIGGSLIYNLTRKPKFAGLLMAPVALMVILLVSWIGFAGDVVKRFERIDTLSESSADARLDTWRDTLPAAFENGWLGSGLGSYRSVHRLYRTDPERMLFEHAENQYVQSLVEAGIPGLTLLVCALVVAFWYVIFLLKRGSSGVTIGAGLFGACLLMGQAVSAIFDFGWYIPANMVLFAAGVGVVGYQAHSLAARLKQKSWLQFQCPSVLTQAIILSVFLFSIFVVYDLYNRAAVYDEVKPIVSSLREPLSVDLEETEQDIQRLAPLVNKSPTIGGLNLMGDLYVHRARMRYLELIRANSSVAELSGEEQTQVDKNLWNLTGLVRIHEYIAARKSQNDQVLLSRFKAQEFCQIDLPQALIYFRTSQKRTPLQPRTQLMVGLLSSILQDFEKAKIELEKAVELSPQNPSFRFSAALVFLQQGDAASAAKHLNHYLTLSPKSFTDVLDIATGRSSRQVVPLEDRLIAEKVIGDDPNQLFVFAKNYLRKDARLKREVLERANRMLSDISLSDSKSLILKSDINFELGDSDVGIEFLESATRSNPNELSVRLRLAEALFKNDRLLEAKSHAKNLLLINGRSGRYLKLLDRIQKKIDEKDISEEGAELKRDIHRIFCGTTLRMAKS